MAGYWDYIAREEAAEQTYNDLRKRRGLLAAEPYRARLLLGDMQMQDQPQPNYMDVRGALSQRGIDPGTARGMPQQATPIGLGPLGQARQMIGMGADPMAVVQNQMAARTAGNETLVLPDKASLINRRGETIASNRAPEPPKIDEGSDLWRDALRVSGGDTTKAAKLLNDWRTRPGTTVNLGGDKALTTVDAKRYEGTTQQLQILDQMEPFLERMMGAIDAGAKTGFGQEWVMPLKQAVEEYAGIKIDGTDEQEVFKSIQDFLGPKMRVPGAGASSDRDVSLFLNSIPTLAKSEGGNLKIKEFYDRVRDRTVQVAQIQQDLLREFDRIPITEERKRIQALGPIFSDDERASLKGPAAQQPKPDAQAIVDELRKRGVVK